MYIERCEYCQVKKGYDHLPSCPDANIEIHPIVQQIVDRHHVADVYTDVINDVLSKLTPKARSELPREGKRILARQVIAAHAANRRLYVAVQRGQF